jgi:hypothetical protein
VRTCRASYEERSRLGIQPVKGWAP